jgi:hypothetical protein
MAESAAAKICVICRQDCSDRPRIKDPKGRYCCKSCYESARQAAEARREAAAAEPAGFGAADEPPLDPMPLESTAAAACPSCGTALPAQAVLCTSCGYDLRTGQSLAAPLPTAAQAEDGARKPSWHLPIGIISIILGISALSLALFGLLGQAAGGPPNAEPGAAAGSLIGGLLPLVLGILCLIAGIGVVMQRPWSVGLIRGWAIAKIVTYVTCFSCLIGLTAVGTAAADQLDQVLGLSGAFLIVALIALLAWFLAWPIFILIWFGRDRIKADVANWS